MTRKLIILIFFLVVYSTCMSQQAIGLFISTNNIPAANFKRLGAGVTAEISDNYNFSLACFGKGGSSDSTFFTADDGSTGYLHYTEKYWFIHASASFCFYLTGGRSSEEKFSAYVGGGLTGIYRIHEIKYNDADLSETSKDQSFIFGFAFLAGIDYKIGVIKPFIRLNGTITLKHIIPGDYDTALPYLGNAQAGVLIPF